MPQLSNKITFTDEQAMLLDIATNFFREKSPTVTVRRQIASESGFDRGLWDEIAELGWLGIAVPERFGGSGLSLADVTVIVEPMGRHLAGTPFTSAQLFIQALLAGGTEQQQRDVLPQICSGAIGSVALFEERRELGPRKYCMHGRNHSRCSAIERNQDAGLRCRGRGLRSGFGFPGRRAGARDREGCGSSARAQDAGDRHR